MTADMLSVFPHDLLRTNRPPDHAQLALARAMIPHFDDEISKLSAQIADVQSQLWKLESRRRTLQRKQTRLKCIVSPIRHVPQDIIRLIFEYCSENPVSVSATRPLSPPIILSHISSGLRKIALDMHTLWNSVSIKTGSLSFLGRFQRNNIVERLASKKSCLQEWIRRSGILPLDLFFDFISTEGSSISQILNIIIPYRARWRKISFVHDGKLLLKETLSRLRCISPGDVPLLQEVSFKHFPASYEDNPGHPFIPIMACPNLRTLSGVCFDGLHIHKDLLCRSFSNLIHLDGIIKRCSLFHLAIILQQCPSLVKLVLHVSELQDENSGYESLMFQELPRLLQIDITEDEDFGNTHSIITKYINAPNMKILNYHARGSINHIVDFFKRSPCITTLDLGGEQAEITSDLLIEALRYCPLLTCLEGIPKFPGYTDWLTPVQILHKHDFDRLFTRLVDADDAGDIICPRLERLDLTGYSIGMPNFHTLHAFVTRKSTRCLDGLVPWKYLHLWSAYVSENDRVAPEELLKGCDPSQIHMQLLYC